jgi:hypothetical protein
MVTVYSTSFSVYVAKYSCSFVTGGNEPLAYSCSPSYHHENVYVYRSSDAFVGVAHPYTGVVQYAKFSLRNTVVPSSSTNVIVYNIGVSIYVAVYTCACVTSGKFSLIA